METKPLEIIRNAAKRGAVAYQSLYEGTGIEYLHIPNIVCGALPDWTGAKKAKTPEAVQNFWNVLHGEDARREINDRPCLYYFEIDSPIEDAGAGILEAFSNYRNQPDCRNCSALKSNAPRETETLYVGKVKKDIGNRMVVHLGYANPKTGGLQLVHWAKQHGLNLHLHIFIFEENMRDFVEPLEYLLAEARHPLIGKHR